MLLAGSLLPHLGWAQAAGLAGTWEGPLAVPGGTVPVIITIAEPAPNRRTAELTLSQKKQARVPLIVKQRGDTLDFFAPTDQVRFVAVPGADGRELRGQWQQTGYRTPLTIRRTTASAAADASAVSTTNSAFFSSFKSVPATVRNPADQVALAGTLTVPNGTGPFPAVVLLSDYGPQNRDAQYGKYEIFSSLAYSLSRQGIAVLRLDDRGVGESGGSGGAATTATRVSDAQAALNYLRTQPAIDASRLGVIGHGEGGNVALLTAAQLAPPAFVGALAASGMVGQELLARQVPPPPYTDTAAVGRERRAALAAMRLEAEKLRASGANAAQVETYLTQQQLRLRNQERKQAQATLKFQRAMLEIVNQTPNNEQAQAVVANMLRQHYPQVSVAEARARAEELTNPWHRYYLRFDPAQELYKVKCPVLLVQGESDAEVEAADNLPALEKGLKQNPALTVRRLPGVNHLLQAPSGSLLASADGQRAGPIVAPALQDVVRDWVLQQVKQ